MNDKTPKTLAERLAAAKAKARKKAHQDAIADRKAVSESNKRAGK
jgi:hypothetical protein